MQEDEAPGVIAVMNFSLCSDDRHTIIEFLAADAVNMVHIGLVKEVHPGKLLTPVDGFDEAFRTGAKSAPSIVEDGVFMLFGHGSL